MKIKDMCLYALFTILIGMGAFIKLPISIVPITLQTLFVVLSGLLLKTKAVYCVLLYIAMGLIGLPIFSNGGGISYVLVPSFGYLLGFIAGAYFIGRFQSDHKNKTFIICCLGVMIIYIFGILYFVFIQYIYYNQVFTLSWLITSLVMIYIPGDCLSILAAIIIYNRLRKYIL